MLETVRSWDSRNAFTTCASVAVGPNRAATSALFSQCRYSDDVDLYSSFASASSSSRLCRLSQTLTWTVRLGSVAPSVCAVVTNLGVLFAMYCPSDALAATFMKNDAFNSSSAESAGRRQLR